MKVALVVVGEILAVSGTILVGFPELVPYYRRVKAATSAAARRFAERIRDWLGVKKQQQPLLTAVSSGIALPFDVTRGDPFAGIEDVELRVVKLMAMYNVVRADVDRLQRATLEQFEAVEKLIAASQGEISAQFEARLREEVALYLPQRALGIPLLILGGVLLGLSGFVG